MGEALRQRRYKLEANHVRRELGIPKNPQKPPLLSPERRTELIGWAMTAIALIGTYMNVHKIKTCFYFWAVSNAYWSYFNYKRKVYPQALLFAVYFCLALWGIRNW